MSTTSNHRRLLGAATAIAAAFALVALTIVAATGHNTAAGKTATGSAQTQAVQTVAYTSSRFTTLVTRELTEHRRADGLVRLHPSACLHRQAVRIVRASAWHGRITKPISNARIGALCHVEVVGVLAAHTASPQAAWRHWSQTRNGRRVALSVKARWFGIASAVGGLSRNWTAVVIARPQPVAPVAKVVDTSGGSTSTPGNNAGPAGGGGSPSVTSGGSSSTKPGGSTSTPGGGSSTSTGGSSTRSVASMKAQMLAWINQQRAANGVAPLTENSCLDGFAQTWANQLPQNFNHQDTNPIWQTCGFDFASENIASDFSVADDDNDWKNSPPHWSNILDPNATQIGIGIYVTSWGAVYACTDFGGFYPTSSGS